MGVSRTDPSQMGVSGTHPSQKGLSGTHPPCIRRVCPGHTLLRWVCPSQIRLRPAGPVTFPHFYFRELVVFSVKHGCERQCTVSRERRQRRLTWRQPPAQHLNACRALREPAGTRGMQPESTRSHHATYDTATCPERACGFANTILLVGRTCQGIPL